MTENKLFQKKHIWARDNPFFDGMRRGEVAMLDKGITASQNILQSVSAMGSRRSKNNLSEVAEHNTSGRLKDLPSVLEPFGQSLSGRWPRIPEPNSSPLPDVHSDIKLKFDDVNDSSKEYISETYDANEETHSLAISAKPLFQKSSTLNKREPVLSEIPLAPSTALFYNGNSPYVEVVQSCQSIHRLNMYLRSTKHEVNAGVPGRFLHAVIGPDISDVGSVAATIMYAFYLHETLQNNQFCTVPIINMKRTEMDSHAELKWLLDSCHVDQSSLLFIDEIDLSYYDLFGSLKLVLVNCSSLPSKQEVLKEALVEIFNLTKNDKAYPWIKNVTLGEEASCCTLIAEKFALTSPEILAGQGFSRLLLAGILLDTANLRNPNTTSKDRYMATLLIRGAGRYGCNGLYRILRSKMYDVLELSMGEILRKDLKKWTRIGKTDSSLRLTVINFGMSSIGISVTEFLSLCSSSEAEIRHFQRMEKLSLLAVVSGYYDAEKKFKREILMSAESPELLKKLIQFIKSSADELPLKTLHQTGIGSEMRVYEIGRITSRKTIEKLLEEFIELSK